MDYTKGYIAGLEVAIAAVNRVFYCPEAVDEVRKLIHDALAEAEERDNMTLEEMLAEFQQPCKPRVLKFAPIRKSKTMYNKDSTF